MLHQNAIAMAAAIAVLALPACNRPEPARESAPAAAREGATADFERKRTDATAEMERRIADLERRWTEMENRIAEKTATATAGLRDEVKEDVKNVREAVADLKTTSPENWWERHERAMERTAEDIETDVRRLTKGQPAGSAEARDRESPATGSPFESRRDQFVNRLRARVDAMADALENVRATGALETEVEDTRARVNKLREDIDRLKGASADDWWDISARRVNDYIDRVEDSIRRLDDNKP